MTNTNEYALEQTRVSTVKKLIAEAKLETARELYEDQINGLRVDRDQTIDALLDRHDRAQAGYADFMVDHRTALIAVRNEVREWRERFTASQDNVTTIRGRLERAANLIGGDGIDDMPAVQLADWLVEQIEHELLPAIKQRDGLIEACERARKHIELLAETVEVDPDEGATADEIVTQIVDRFRGALKARELADRASREIRDDRDTQQRLLANIAQTVGIDTHTRGIDIDDLVAHIRTRIVALQARAELADKLTAELTGPSVFDADTVPHENLIGYAREAVQSIGRVEELQNDRDELEQKLDDALARVRQLTSANYTLQQAASNTGARIEPDDGRAATEYNAT